MFRILSKSLVQQILEYSSSVCGPYTNASARKIEQIQRRATKIMENIKDVSYSDHIVSSECQHFKFDESVQS